MPPTLPGFLPGLATSIPVLLLIFAVISLLANMPDGTTPVAVPQRSEHKKNTHLEYSTVTGFFLQDDIATDPDAFDALKQNFGLVDQQYDTDSLLASEGTDLTQWQRFAHKLKVMNEKAEQGTSYRLLYLGRHGQGYHNVAEDFYGTDAWNCYFSTLDCDPNSPEVVFYDAHLSRLGIAQAENLSVYWSGGLTIHRMPAPETYYTSPLSRAIQTADLTFSSISAQLPKSAPFKLIVKELLREGHGIHTCDKRPSQSYLTSTYPFLIIPKQDNFAENDELYSPDLREPPQAHEGRLRLLLDDVLANDNSTFISMTSHSGTIATILRVIKHREFKLQTAGVIPVVVKIQETGGESPKFDLYDKTGWETKPPCLNDPAKAGKDGYKNIGDYVKKIEDDVAHSFGK